MTRATWRNRPVSALILILLLLVLGVGALAGGGGMLMDPTGVGIGVDVSMLEAVPVNDFLIPGLILFILFGMGSVITVYGLWARPDWAFLQRLTPWRDYHWSWTWTRVIAVLQLLWIGLEFLMWGMGSFLQPLFGGLALAMLIMCGYDSVKRYLWMRDEPFAAEQTLAAEDTEDIEDIEDMEDIEESVG